MECDLPNFILDKNLMIQQVNTTCVCCLAENVQFIYLKTCVHSTLLKILFGNMLKDEDQVCVICHSILKNFHIFKLQVEKNIKMVNQQNIRIETISNIEKIHNLQVTSIDVYDSLDDKINNSNKIDKPKYELKNKNIDLKVEIDNYNNLKENSINYHDITFYIEQELPLTNIKQEELSEIEQNNTINKLKIKQKGYKHKINKNIKTKINGSLHIDKQQIKTKWNTKNTLRNDENDILSERCDEINSSTQENIVNSRFTCDSCDRMFRSKSTLKRHIIAAHANDEIPCKYCAKVFKNALSHRRHVKYFHERIGADNDSAPVQCPICLHMFKMNKTLQVHLKKIHVPDIGGKEEERYCVECNKLFKSRTFYERHLNDSPKHAAHRYECHDCGRKFTLKGNLMQHIKCIHLNKRNHVCSVCGKSFFKEYRRRRHEQYEHQGVPRARPHACALCGKAFECWQGVKRHMVVHSGAKPYQCAHCPSRFNQTSSLRTHCRYKHKDLT